MKKFIIAIALLIGQPVYANDFAIGAMTGIAGLTLFQNIFRPIPYSVYQPAPVYVYPSYPVYQRPVCMQYPTYWIDVYGIQHWYTTTRCN